MCRPNTYRRRMNGNTSDHPQTPDPPSRQLGVSEAAAGPSPEGSMRSWEAPAARGGTLGARRRSGSRRPSQYLLSWAAPVCTVITMRRPYFTSLAVLLVPRRNHCQRHRCFCFFCFCCGHWAAQACAIYGAAPLTRRLLLAKLRAAPSRIDEPQFPRLLLELPGDLCPRNVHPSTCELAVSS